MNVPVDAAEEPLEVYRSIQCLRDVPELLHAAAAAESHTKKC